jgi:hypothetical protein
MMRTSFAAQGRASRKSRSKRTNACSTVGRPASKFDRITRSRVLGKFSTDCEASQKRRVNACDGIGFPQTLKSLGFHAFHNSKKQEFAVRRHLNAFPTLAMPSGL